MTTDSNVVETIFKTKEGYNECDHCQSVLSPAAYFIKLMETVNKYIVQPDLSKSLKSRRPDLYSELKLDCDNTNKEKLYLEIVNEIMEKKLNQDLEGNALYKLATAKYPFNLPANFPLMSIRAYLKEHNTSLAEVYKALLTNADTTLEDLDLSQEAYETIISTDTTNLKEVYGINENQSLDKLKEVDRFLAHTDVSHEKLQSLLDSYNKTQKLVDSKRLTINNKSINFNNDNQALRFLHCFIRLTNKLGWSFEELSNVFVAINKHEINADVIKLIAQIKNLQKRFKQPVTKIAELYSQEDILSKKAENLKEFKTSLNNNYSKLQELAKDANSQSALQSVLGINSSELTSLIEYNDSKNTSSQTGKLLLFRAYKQTLLARLLGISITRLTELLLLLNINELNSDNMENVIELNDWLKAQTDKICQTIKKLFILYFLNIISHGSASTVIAEIDNGALSARVKAWFWVERSNHWWSLIMTTPRRRLYNLTVPS